MINNNIIALRQYLDLTQQDFADRLEMPVSTLRNYEQAKSAITQNFFEKLVYVFNVNLNWLVTGQGSMFNDKDISITAGDYATQSLFGNIKQKNQYQKEDNLCKNVDLAILHQFLKTYEKLKDSEEKLLELTTILAKIGMGKECTCK